MTVHSVKHKKRVIGCFSIILFIILGSAFGISVLKVVNAKKEKPEVYEERIPVYNVFSTNITVIKTFNTIIKPDKRVEISAAIGEEIKKIYVEIGSVVTQGQILIELDKRYKKIEVRKGMSKALESIVALSNATIDLSNNQGLYDAKVVGDDVLRKYIVSHRNAIAENENTEAILDYAKERLTDCTINAPFNGKICKRYVETGERILPGQPLLDMIDDTMLRVITFVGDRDISEIKRGKNIVFNISEIDKANHTATVAFVSSDVEPKSLLYRFEALYDNKNSIVKPGIGRVKVPLRHYKDIIVIPSYTIKNDAEGNFVTLLVGTSNVNVRIETGREYKQWFEIKDGLKTGDKIILK